MSTIDYLLRLGQKVDPTIHEYLSKGAHSDFLPVAFYQVDTGGKRVRSALAMVCCEAVGGRVEQALVPAALVELIHNYSLIMDDIIDYGFVRRGLQTVRAKYSDAMAILAMAFYREVLDEMVDDCPKPDRMRALLIETIKMMVEGERLDVLFEQAGRRENYIVSQRYRDVSWQLYFNMIEKKTSALFRASCVAGCIAADASESHVEALSEYGRKIGLSFQVSDDYLDIFGEKTGKERGKDIIQHKLGNAVLLSAFDEMAAKDRAKVLKGLRSSIVRKGDVTRVLRLIEKTDAQARTRKLAQSFADEAKEKLGILKESEAKKALIELADFIVKRSY